MSETVWIVQTTLSGEMNEAEVGMWCQPIIDSNLAACVKVKRANSIFRWDERTQNIPEWDIQITTSEPKKNKLISEIISKHPYDLPQIIWWSAQSTKEYYDWVQA